LHLGKDGQNWHGRATPRLDNGFVPPQAAERLAAVRRMHESRKKYGYKNERF
jgi:hypothetical protein